MHKFGYKIDNNLFISQFISSQLDPEVVLNCTKRKKQFGVRSQNYNFTMPWSKIQNQFAL